jgi:predicted regulator of Ras-like GTPase activity (Roadblock/LC7/MglB family)
MLSNSSRPDTVEQLSGILAELNQQPMVHWAVLSSEDGLPIENPEPVASQLAAVAGFLQANTRQAWAMLGLRQEQEVVVTIESNYLIVCRSFEAAGMGLILAVVFTGAPAYKRVLAQTIRAIQQAMGHS